MFGQLAKLLGGKGRHYLTMFSAEVDYLKSKVPERVAFLRLEAVSYRLTGFDGDEDRSVG